MPKYYHIKYKHKINCRIHSLLFLAVFIEIQAMKQNHLYTYAHQTNHDYIRTDMNNIQTELDINSHHRNLNILYYLYINIIDKPQTCHSL